MVPWLTTVDKNSNFIKMHDFPPKKVFHAEIDPHKSNTINNICTMSDSNIFYTYPMVIHNYRVDKNTEISDRPKIMNLHAFSIRPSKS